MKQFFKTLVLMVGLFLLSQVPSLIIGGVLAYNQSLDKGSFGLVQTASSTFVFLIIGALIVQIAQKRDIFSPLSGRKTRSLWVSLSIAYAIIVLGNVLSSWVLKLEGQTDTVNQAGLYDLMKMVPIPLFFVMVVVVAPITEEIIFRGLAAKYLFPKKEWVGLIAGSAIFALVHRPTNFGSAIAYGLMSAALAFVYWHTKDIKYSMAMHTFNNLIAFVSMLISPI
ncbi:CPBP family intramembrane glutamic endopeptidase [Streptococcus halotolerans]|uniref:CPBP family intramembrane glutamic endopeptidase n=1 Tax=Streptococcus halotolerans TaxID=1814128 RepID=UPI000788590D|nr:type II CAAX endopeptidase family protein [Streptococcus halotolerans]